MNRRVLHLSLLPLRMKKAVSPLGLGAHQKYEDWAGLKGIGQCISEIQFEMTLKVLYQHFHNL